MKAFTKNTFSLMLIGSVVASIALLSPSSEPIHAFDPGDKDTLKSNIAGPLEFKGTVEELTRAIKGAIVTVYEDADGTKEQMTEIKKLVTPGNGTFELKFEINKFYLITVEKAGYTTKGIDVDTDVRFARPEHTKVPPFEFKVDMVQDKDGLSFKKSVANVFYQIKRNAFDYELDYSKEEMEEEERLLREQEEKRRLAELAAQKKFEMEEAAKLLREMDDASMEEKIKAAVTLGNEDRQKTIAALTEVFAVNDTLKEKKAEVVYEELQKERESGKAVADINFKGLFAAANALEREVVTESEKEQDKKREELRAIREDAERKKEAAMLAQQQALEVEMREKIAAANLRAEEQRMKEQKEKDDKLYFAIFSAQGDRKTAVANIVKTYPRDDKYAEQKANAVFDQYEKTRLTGKTLAQMDFKQLFAAADMAEQEAVKEEIAKADAKDRIRTDAFLQKEEQRASEEQRKIADAIMAGLQRSGEDDNARMNAFVESLPKTDPFRNEKGRAMFEEYQRQQKLASEPVNLPKDIYERLAAAPKDERSQIAVIVNSLPKEMQGREEKAKALYDGFRRELNERSGANIITESIARQLQNAPKDEASQLAIVLNTLPKGEAQREMKAREALERYRKREKALSVVWGDQLIEELRSSPQDERSQLAVFLKTVPEGAPDREKKAKEKYAQYVSQERGESLALSAKLSDRLKDAKDENQQLAAFVESFSSDDPKRFEKARVLLDEYTEQKKALNKATKFGSELDFGAMFAASQAAERDAAEKQKLEIVKQKEAEQAALEQKREEARLEKIRLGEQAAKEAREIQVAKMKDAKTKRERDLAQALDAGGGDKQKTVAEIIKTFPKDTELPELKAEAIYDAYVEEGKKQRSSGGSAQLDFAVLFAAAEQAELRALEREYEEKLLKEEAQIVAYEEQRMVATKEAALEVADQAKAELAAAEIAYQRTVTKVERESQARLEEEARIKEDFDQQASMERAKRDAMEREREDIVLARLEEGRKQREALMMTEEEQLAAAQLEAQRKAEAAAKAEADRLLAQAEKERQLAFEAQRKAEAERVKEQERLAAEAEKNRIAAAEAAAKAEEDRKRNEQRLAAEAEKARIAAEKAAAQAEAERKKEEQLLAQEAEKARVAAEKAAAMADAEQRKEEERKAAEAERARIAAQQAAAKAEEERRKEQERLAAEAERARILADQAAAKAAEERRKEEERLAAEAAKAELERQRQAELAAEAERKRKEEEERQRLLTEQRERDAQIARYSEVATKAFSERRYDDAISAFNMVLGFDQNSTLAKKGIADSEAALAAIAKAEAERKVLDERYAKLIATGERQVGENDLKAAKSTFTEAAALKPNDSDAKDGLALVARMESQLAEAEEQRQSTERQYLVFLQEGDRALGANNLAVAKVRYQEALNLKPNESEPKNKLQQIADKETELALEAEKKRQREEEAKRKFEEQQRQAELARLEAISAADAVKTAEEDKGLSEQEKRAKEFDRLKENVAKLNISQEEQRKTFLSALAKLYPEGVTEELVEAKNYTVIRNVINQSGVVTVYEQRTWDWGGVFWFKNGDISITESLYKLELSRVGK